MSVRQRAAQMFLLAIAAAVFVALRLRFNVEYEGAPWAALVAGTAKLPFGHRVLIPSMVSPWVSAGISIRHAFAVTEWLATMAALGGTVAALQTFMPRKSAIVASAPLVLVLGLLFLLRFRWPIFYPWDVPAIAAMTWGVAWARKCRYLALLLLSAFAAANRESAILLPAIVVVLSLSDPPKRAAAWRWASLMVVTIVLVRFSITVGWASNPGTAIHWRLDGTWRVLNNIRWLRDPSRALQILGAFSLLPVLWLLFRAHMPASLRRLEWLWVAAVAGLLVVANVYEPRAFGEPVALAYLGVAVGVQRWASNEAVEEDAMPPWLAALDRWGVPMIAVLWLLSLAWFYTTPAS